MNPRQLLNAIIDAEAAYHGQNGRPAATLTIPYDQAAELLKLEDEPRLARFKGQFTGQKFEDQIVPFTLEDGIEGIPAQVRIVPNSDAQGFFFGN